MNNATLAESLTEEALILRLRSTEHDFVERKSRSDRGAWLQTAVAFANSAPIGWPAILFVGVDDDGKPQQNADKLEDLMKSVSGILDQAYPSIYRLIVPIHLSDGGCLAVVIPGNESRPHFAGKSYIRDGPQTKDASEEQFESLIAERQSKVREISRWIDKRIIIAYRRPDSSPQVTLRACNQFYLTFETVPHNHDSIPLSRVQISFDNQLKMLKLEVERWTS